MMRTCENLDAVYIKRHGVDTVGFDDIHPVAVDGESIARVARDGDDAKAVSDVATMWLDVIV
jgi:hypothetical protein